MSEHAAPVQAVQAAAPQPAQNGFHLQRKCACGSYAGGGECDKCREDKTKLQRAACGPTKPEGLPPIVHDVLRSSGQPLDTGTRAWMEPRFGHDFSGVRVHTDARAAESAQAVNALAYTVGPDLVFGAGQYAPGTERGGRLLAHELTHVVQQLRGGASAQQAKAISEPSDAAEIEADATANRVMNGGSAQVSQAPTATLHALSAGETAGVVVGSVLAGAGAILGALALAGVFDREHYSDAELTEYLTVLATTRRPENNRNSDNKARDVVRRWRGSANPSASAAPSTGASASTPATSFNIDNGFSTRGGSLTGVELKRLLVEEMLSGVTAGEDENAILTILENSAPGDLVQILDPNHGVSIQQLDDKIGGDNHARLEAILEQRFPRTSDVRRDTAPSCTARQSLMIDYARQQGLVMVDNAIDVLTNRSGDEAVVRKIQCRFEGAGSAELASILAIFQGARAALGTRLYHCAPEGGVAELEAPPPIRATTGEELPPVQCDQEDANSFRTEDSAFREVYLCGAFFRRSPEIQALTLVHEAAHAAGLGLDVAYQPGCGLALQSALRNADSYAFLAADLMSVGASSRQTPQMQRKATSDESPDELPEVVEDALHSPGQPLDGATRERMEPGFNRDFSEVRVHTGSAAAQSARSVNAHAYTVGQDVVFGAGQYDPGTEKGVKLLAHELTHVVQQSESGPPTTQTAKPISEPDDAAEIEADSVAEQVLRGDTAVEVNQSPSAAVHAELSGGEKGLIAGGVILGGIGAGFLVAAAIGAFDTSRFRNCSQQQQDVVNTATNTAQRWIETAITRVDAVLGNPQQAEPFVVEQLWEHFKIRPDDREHLNRVRQGLGQIQTGFSELMFECDSSCTETEDTAVAARVPGLLGGIVLKYGRIHVCPRFFRGPRDPDFRRDDEQPETIAHEMGHRFVGARGDVYRVVDPRGYSNLTTDQALDNADSYAQFARVVFNIGSRSAAPAANPLQRKAIGSGGPHITPVRRKLQRQPAPETQPEPATQTAPESAPAPETKPTAETQPAPEPQPKPEVKPEQRAEAEQPGGIPKVDPTSGMEGHPAPPGCVDVLWAREYPRIFRLDTISVVGLSAKPAGEKAEEVRDARRKNALFDRALGEVCAAYENVKHPFRVRFYSLDVDPRNAVRERVNTEDAKRNRELGDSLGATQTNKVRIYVERSLESEEDFADVKTLDEKLKKIIDKSSQSGAKRGAKTGLIVGSILGGLTAIGVGIGVGAAVSASGGGLGAILGYAALAGGLAGGAVLGLSAGLGALFGHAGGTDRGTAELSKERIKEVQTFVALLRKTGEIKGDQLTSSDADNLARDAVTLWTDDARTLPLTVKDRRLLILAMLDGPTLDADERAIIKLFENSTDAEILQVLDPTVDPKERVTLQKLDEEIHGEEWKEFRQMLRARFPSLGAPEVQRTETATEPACEADQAIMILQARKRATEVVPIALQRITEYLADPAKQQATLTKIQCYFPNAARADIEKIKGMFDSIQQLIPSSRYVCPGKKTAVAQTPPGPRVVECEKGDVAQTVPFYAPDGSIKATKETYICPLFFEQGPVYQATSMIHEWVHRVIPDSETDKYDPKCGDPNLATALINPDSYALLARDLAEGRAANSAGQPSVSIGNFRNAGAVTAENRCVSCPQIPTLGLDPTSGVNFMELRGDITGHRPDALYDFKRTKEVAIWMRVSGAWQNVKYEPPGTLDDASADDEDVAVKNDRIYSVDGPGLHQPIPSPAPPEIEGGLYKGSFTESVNVKVGQGPWTQSSNLFAWHSLFTFERGNDGIVRRTPKNNEIEPGPITIGPDPPGP